MGKRKNTLIDLSQDSLIDKLTRATLSKNEYLTISDTVRMFKDSFEYRLLRAIIDSTVKNHLRVKTPSDENAFKLGLISGLETSLALIDSMERYEDIAKEEKISEEESEPEIINDSTSIN